MFKNINYSYNLRKNSYAVGGDAVLDEASKLFLVSFLILLHQEPHVLGHVQAQNVLAVDLSVELFAFRIIARESLGARKKRETRYSRYRNQSRYLLIAIQWAKGQDFKKAGLSIRAVLLKLTRPHIWLHLNDYVRGHFKPHKTNKLSFALSCFQSRLETSYINNLLSLKGIIIIKQQVSEKSLVNYTMF